MYLVAGTSPVYPKIVRYLDRNIAAILYMWHIILLVSVAYCNNKLPTVREAIHFT